MNNHLKAIKSGNVTKTNVIGIRKALNAMARRQRGYSTGRTCPQLSFDECDQILSALAKYHPTVTGELHDSGVKLLRDKRYKKRWNDAQRAIIESEHIRFDLVGYEEYDQCNFVPIYRAVSFAGSFDYRAIAWQSGGNGPEIVA